MKRPLIVFDQVRKIYKTGPVEYEALRGVSFTIQKGEFVAIMGPSGSGKSTIMNIMGALDQVSFGEYRLNDKVIDAYDEDDLAQIRNREIGFIFQSFNLLPRMTVYKNIERPLLYGKVPKKERHERVIESLTKVGLEAKAQNMSNHISGGQIQRVAIARALAMKPSLLLADEPTGNLDTKTAHEIMSFFKEVNEQGNTIVLITHEPDIAKFANRTIMVKDGLVERDK